ncbi:N-acetylglucosamine-6-phosphate deacetylase [Pelomyxa schiedti]|nr:N-acetylglucosamine-6-phosphate deacetylase [Pelomyxa schiedti]
MIVVGDKVVVGGCFGEVYDPGFVEWDPLSGLVTRVGHGVPSQGRLDELSIPASEVPHYNLVMPGFVDIHNHGAGSLATDVIENWSRPADVLGYLGSVGTTSCLASLTLPSDNLDITHRINETLRGHINEIGLGCVLRGVHCEGPVIETLGGLPNSEAYISPKAFSALLDDTPALKMMTVSPSLAAKYDYWHIKQLVERGIKPALGHDLNANAQNILGALSCSKAAMHITHMFNVSSFHHRNMGLCNFGMVKKFPNLPEYSGLVPPTVEVIGDLIHINPLVIQALLDQNRDNVCFVTDAVACGKDLTRNKTYLGRPLSISDRVTVAGTNTLAGSCVDMMQIFRSLNIFGLTPEQASPMLSSIPAKIAGLLNVGTLSVGMSCDFVAFDGPENTLEAVVSGGNKIL